MSGIDPATLALAALAAVAGCAAGFAHFRSLQRVAELFVAGRLSAVALQLARLAGLAAFLVLCGLAGAPVLLAGAAGVLVGRALALRRTAQADREATRWTRP